MMMIHVKGDSVSDHLSLSLSPKMSKQNLGVCLRNHGGLSYLGPSALPFSDLGKKDLLASSLLFFPFF